MRVESHGVLESLQKNPSRIRNICVLAHVDHGKTTISDFLVAKNGIISQRMAGKLRYMDSRKDEQERGITMKSSAVALHHKFHEENYLINLIDSPGHIDFTAEVWTGLQLCDGAFVVVDVVEGVCPQTRSVLRQAWEGHIRPVLVLNKMDRLIVEKKLSPIDAHVHLTNLLGQINAVMGELFASDVMGKEELSKAHERRTSESCVYDWTSPLEEAEDDDLYFSPDRGNVVFASAIDGWGFRVKDFARICSEKLGIREDVLNKTLWGNYYISVKQKKILPGAQEKAKKPLFVQFVLENLWKVYEATVERKDKVMLEKIVQSLGIRMHLRDARHTDPRVQVHAVCSQWLPLATVLMDMACEKLPSPLELSVERAEDLMSVKGIPFSDLPEETKLLKSAFLECSCTDDAPLIVMVSKMFPFEKKNLPERKSRPLTVEELSRRREQAKQRLAEKVAPVEQLSDNISSCQDTVEVEPEADDVFVAFARIFSGKLKQGNTCYVLGPKHDCSSALREQKTINPALTIRDLPSGQHITQCTIKELYVLMGREMECLSEASAGNIVGIGSLEDHILKSATLSSTVACPAFAERISQTTPILRVSVEPTRPSDMSSLVTGLKLLNQADPCVQVMVQETGEHVLLVAGEVHLERCLDDLRERFAKVSINSSAPIIPFRETVIIPPKLDMMNEAIQEQNQIIRKVEDEEDSKESGDFLEILTANKASRIQMKAVPLPAQVVTLLENHVDQIRRLENTDPEKISSEVCKFKQELQKAFSAAGPDWCDAVDHIWSFGPRRCGPNILLNRVPHFDGESVWNKSKSKDVNFEKYETNFISGFQMATLSGPLCEEPMMGVCFVVSDWSIDLNLFNDVNPSDSSSLPYGPFSGQVMSAVKEGCRKAFQAQPQRLMAAMYSCDISLPADSLGRLYAVLGRRHGRVLSSDRQEGSHVFQITAVLPVVESLQVANEIRKQTSGMAYPQMMFSHWEIIEVDPWWEPSTLEEIQHYGEKADSANIARTYMNAVRRRKGLPVKEFIVEKAEKQRTLTRNK